MGLVNFGVPVEEVVFLKDAMGLNIFVEGGTYRGDTAKDMSTRFETVYTIENSEVMFCEAMKSLDEIENVKMLKGDTRVYLPEILEKNDNLLFWLDAHWSGGDTYGENDECPLILELETIFKFKRNNVILIDDARLFLSPPPLPHKIKNWPSLMDIVNVMPKGWDLIELDDVIYLFPDNVAGKFKVFLQGMITKKHINKPKSPIQRILNKIGGGIDQ